MSKEHIVQLLCEAAMHVGQRTKTSAGAIDVVLLCKLLDAASVLSAELRRERSGMQP
jgi:hypothetical protein